MNTDETVEAAVRLLAWADALEQMPGIGHNPFHSFHVGTDRAAELNLDDVRAVADYTKTDLSW